ncbi:MAG: 4a-hydroxytetrahydrobiopterin dehydratase [Gammaproteobacteria bacterium]
MTADEARKLLGQLHGDWSLNDDATEIRRDFSFKGFYRTMGFVNAVAWVANMENHHPDLEVGWGHCLVRFSTHSISGLSENDFICAAKVDALLGE